MDNRRTLTRGRQREVKKVDVKRNSLRSSPSRRVSPTRKTSPLSNRKSPSRRGSPGRKASPTRRASPAPRPPSTTNTRSSRQRSAVVTPIPVVRPSPIKEKKEMNTSPKVKLDKMNTEILATESTKPTSFITTTSSSVHSSFSISTHKTTDIGTSKNTSGDSEVAKLTDFIRRSVSKTLSTSQRGTSQTPSTHPSHISRSVSQSLYDDGDNYTKTEFSDSEEEENFKSVHMTSKLSYTPLFEKSSSLCRKLEVPKEFGGLFGASVLLIAFPILGYYLPWCCKKSICGFQKPNLAVLKDFKYIEKVFNSQAVGSYVAFCSGIFLLSAGLFGRYVRLPSDRIRSGYHFNTFPIAVILTILFAFGEYKKYQIADFILKNYLRFCLFSLLNAFITSIWCYTRSLYDLGQDLQINPYARSGSFVVDFSLGKHINPKWFGKIEIKQFYYKISLIFTLLIAEVHIVKNIQEALLTVTEDEAQTFVGKLFILTKLYIDDAKYDQTALLLSIMLLIYAMDVIVFEHHLASSFELQHEGVGALLLFRYAATPFILSMVTKFTFDHKPITMGLGLKIPMLTVFFSGLIIKRLSSGIKYRYRINPNLAMFSDMETVHTFQGRRLLLGNFWGRIRQPNYAGEILILLSFLGPLFIKFSWPPMICILLLIAFIFHRAKRVNLRNSARYHSSWVRYCTKVKHLIIPKIF